MKSPFIYKGSTEAFETKTDNYIYKGLTATQAKQQRIEKRPYSAPERHRVRGKNSLKKIYVILRAKPERIKLLEK